MLTSLASATSFMNGTNVALSSPGNNYNQLFRDSISENYFTGYINANSNITTSTLSIGSGLLNNVFTFGKTYVEMIYSNTLVILLSNGTSLSFYASAGLPHPSTELDTRSGCAIINSVSGWNASNDVELIFAAGGYLYDYGFNVANKTLSEMGEIALPAGSMSQITCSHFGTDSKDEFFVINDTLYVYNNTRSLVTSKSFAGMLTSNYSKIEAGFFNTYSNVDYAMFTMRNYSKATANICSYNENSSTKCITAISGTSYSEVDITAGFFNSYSLNRYIGAVYGGFAEQVTMAIYDYELNKICSASILPGGNAMYNIDYSNSLLRADTYNDGSNVFPAFTFTYFTPPDTIEGVYIYDYNCASLSGFSYKGMYNYIKFNKYGTSFADVNGDLILDYLTGSGVVTGTNKQYHLLTYADVPLENSQINFSLPGAYALLDMNDDSLADLLMSNSTSTSVWYQNYAPPSICNESVTMVTSNTGTPTCLNSTIRYDAVTNLCEDVQLYVDCYGDGAQIQQSTFSTTPFVNCLMNRSIDYKAKIYVYTHSGSLFNPLYYEQNFGVVINKAYPECYSSGQGGKDINNTASAGGGIVPGAPEQSLSSIFEGLGFKTVASKCFLALIILIIVTIGVAKFGPYVIAIVDLITFIGLVFIGLIPFWVLMVIAIMMIFLVFLGFFRRAGSGGA